MKADELVTKCEKITGWKNIKSLLHSFTDNFGDYKKIISDNKLEGDEIDKFIEVCNIKTERAKILMSDIGTVLSIIITAAVTVILSSKIIDENLSKYAILITFLPLAVFFIALRAHYRFHIHAWAAFKEGAILNRQS